MGSTLTLREAISGTLIDEILAATTQGKAVDIPEKVAPEEKVIGLMSQLEMALRYLEEVYTKEHNTLIDSLRHATDLEKHRETRQKIYELSLRVDAMNTMMWESIQRRFREKNEVGSVGFGIREGGHVVLIFKQENRLLNLLQALR